MLESFTEFHQEMTSSVVNLQELLPRTTIVGLSGMGQEATKIEIGLLLFHKLEQRLDTIIVLGGNPRPAISHIYFYVYSNHGVDVVFEVLHGFNVFHKEIQSKF